MPGNPGTASYPIIFERTMKSLRMLPLFVIAVLFVGCSKSATLVPVSGKLTMNGKPLGNVKVDFQPDPDQGTKGLGSSGTTDAEGNFTLTYSAEGKPGAIPGFHRVILTDLDVFGNTFVGRGDYRTEAPGGPKETPKRARFPELYGDLAKTPFKQEVKPGMGLVTLEIKR